MPRLMHALVVALLACGLGGCGESARLAVREGMGPSPRLPAPVQRLLPTVDVAEAQPWTAGAMPTAAPGFRVQAFARGLQHPRWLYLLPNGDVLVAETDAPERPAEGAGSAASS